MGEVCTVGWAERMPRVEEAPAEGGCGRAGSELGSTNGIGGGAKRAVGQEGGWGDRPSLPTMQRTRGRNIDLLPVEGKREEIRLMTRVRMKLSVRLRLSLSIYVKVKMSGGRE